MNDFKSLLQRIYDLTQIDLQNKNRDELFACPAEELGEIARELKIEEKVFGNEYKTPDEGSKAEAVDFFIGVSCMYLSWNSVDELDRAYDRYRQKHIVCHDNVFHLLKLASRHIGNCENNIDAGIDAINIFKNRGGTDEEFLEIAFKKLNKWEASQKGLLERK